MFLKAYKASVSSEVTQEMQMPMVRLYIWDLSLHFFMLKRNGGGYNYYMSDNKRFTGSETANPAHSKQNADESPADEVHPIIDFLSNGVKIRQNESTVNSAVTHLYWAFAEAPFVNSSGVPNNAE